MVKDQANLSHGPRTYHGQVFEQEINDLINITQSHYEVYVNLCSLFAGVAQSSAA